MNAIEVRNLRKTYGTHTAVDEISFTVAAGEVYGMLGPNGAGKTTTVECIEGLRRPDAGEVRVLGMTHGRQTSEIKARMGVGLQTTGLFPKLTVREIINLYATFFPRSLPTADLIEQVGLAEKAGAYSAQLSGGQKQRLAIALALVNDPDLIFLDEPTTAMDPAGRRSVWEMVLDLKARGKTVVLTTHYMEEAAHLCDRVAVVDRGRIIAEGRPDDLVRQHFAETAIEFATPKGVAMDRLMELAGVNRVMQENGSTTLLSTEVPETVAALLAFARAQGFRLDRFTVRNATLEDLFLRLTGRRIRE
ncbi:MAG: transporter related [Symbiobacteriaceae bacterium]|jgi:ABC-2 type transport system ATP-binding protein|nr:transporter related [Symbiobacteriaceae bacterium]